MISEELLRNMALALMAVFIVTLIVLANIWACLLVFTCVGFTLVSGQWYITLGMRVSWDVYNKPGLLSLLLRSVVLLSFTTLCDWFKKTRPLYPTNQKQGNKPFATWSLSFSRSFRWLRVFYSCFDSFIAWFVSAAIGY